MTTSAGTSGRENAAMIVPDPPFESHLSKDKFTINPVRSPEDLDETIKLFHEYAKSLNLDLSFQSFEEEMSSMPGKYSPEKGGELLLARNARTDEAIGCVALRRILVSEISKSTINSNPDIVDADADTEATNNNNSKINDTTITSTPPKTAEMKRLYTSPESRGLGLGTALVGRALEVAKSHGYNEIKLDTLRTMVGAQKVYEKFGFVDVQPYCFNPVEGVRFLGLRLDEQKKMYD